VKRYKTGTDRLTDFKLDMDISIKAEIPENDWSGLKLQCITTAATFSGLVI